MADDGRIPVIPGRNVFFGNHSTESDSNFSVAERCHFYALLRGPASTSYKVVRSAAIAAMG